MNRRLLDDLMSQADEELQSYTLKGNEKQSLRRALRRRFKTLLIKYECPKLRSYRLSAKALEQRRRALASMLP